LNRKDRKVPTGSKTWRANRNGGRGCGNGLQALIRPATGEPDARRGAGSRTGRRRIRQEVKEAGRELQPRRGGLETGSRPGRAKGRIETSASSLTVARRLSGQRSVTVKSRCGEQRRRRGQVSRCRVRAGLDLSMRCKGGFQENPEADVKVTSKQNINVWVRPCKFYKARFQEKYLRLI
jgi:hypothetical protein